MAGVRKANRRDVTVVLLEPGAAVAGVFTANRFCAAPVQICREHLAAGSEVRAILVNTGNANAGTGDDGLARARSTCAALAARLGCAPRQVLPFSTGVIMETLPNDRIEAGLPAAIADARADGWSTAAEAIMTTDTVPKAASTTLQIGGRTVAVTGISKGAGMIRPNMATMLGFVATDAAIAPALVQQLVREAADESFNRITIDGDTSTNDSFVLIATQRAGNAPIDEPRQRRRPGPARSGVRRLAAPRPGDRARRRGRDQVHHHPRRRRRQRRANAARSPTPSAIRRWSRRRSSPAIRTSAGSWRRSATPASTTSTRPGSISFSTTFMSSRAAAAARPIARRTVSG